MKAEEFQTRKTNGSLAQGQEVKSLVTRGRFEKGKRYRIHRVGQGSVIIKFGSACEDLRHDEFAM